VVVEVDLVIVMEIQVDQVAVVEVDQVVVVQGIHLQLVLLKEIQEEMQLEVLTVQDMVVVVEQLQ
tara:strand:- start:317 stop:511 length:195 start_codon:yes stop_codon:yes gene_type:complete